MGLRGTREQGSGEKYITRSLYNLSHSPNIIRVIKAKIMRWAEHVARIENSRGAYRVLVGGPDRKGTLRRPRHR